MKNKGILHWALIGTFGILYLLVAYVSLLHAIDFFGLGNGTTLSILLAVAYEVGQSSVLFSILAFKNKKNKFLTWAMMILLTSVQVTANVFSTFKYMVENGEENWKFWQRSILFWLDASGAEMYIVTISWIIGALLPLVALGMTALIVDLMQEDDDDDEYEYEEEDEDEDDEPNEALSDAAEKYKKEVLESEHGIPTFHPKNSEISLQGSWVPEDVTKVYNEDREVVDYEPRNPLDEVYGPPNKDDIFDDEGIIGTTKPVEDTIKEVQIAMDGIEKQIIEEKLNPGEDDIIIKETNVQDIIMPEVYEEPIVDDKDQIRLDFDKEEEHSDFDDILNNDIDDIIKESEVEEMPEPKKEYPAISKPVKGQEILDKVEELIHIKPTIIESSKGAEIVDVKAISKKDK
jgi:hypothetical protein